MSKFTTKSEAITYFNSLPLDTLNTLATTLDRILLPDQSMMLKVSFFDLVDYAHSLADMHFPQWTDRSKADFGEFLVELMALFSEKDFMYLNAYAQEAFTREATKYSTVYAHALSKQGYKGKTFKASKHFITLTFTAGVSALVDKKLLSVTVAGAVFVPENNISVSTLAEHSKSISFLRGIWITATAKYNGRSIYLPQSNIDTERIGLVDANNDSWTQVASLAQSRPSDRHFIVIPETNGACQIFLPKGGFGFTPELGSEFTVTYLSGAGEDSTTYAGGFEIKDNAGARQITSTIVYNGRAYIGQNAESIESLKRAAAAYFATQGSILNSFDVEEALLEFSEVLKSKCVGFINAFTYYVVPVNPATVEADLIAYIDKEIRAKRLVQGFTVGGAATQYVPITISATAYAVPGFDLTAIEADVKTWFETYTDPRGSAAFGQDFVLATIVSRLISEIGGLQNFVFSLVNGAAPANVVVADTSIMSKIDWSNPSNILTVV